MICILLILNMLNAAKRNNFGRVRFGQSTRFSDDWTSRQITHRYTPLLPVFTRRRKKITLNLMAHTKKVNSRTPSFFCLILIGINPITTYHFFKTIPCPVFFLNSSVFISDVQKNCVLSPFFTLNFTKRPDIYVFPFKSFDFS